MFEITKVAVLGAGAIGSYYASQLSKVNDIQTVLLAQGKRKDRLTKEGLIVNDVTFKLPVIDPEETNEVYDLILIALKDYQLPEALPMLNNIVGPTTIFLSLMNGLDSENQIADIYEADKVLYGISVAIDAVREGNKTRYSNAGKITFGEKDNTNLSPRVQAVQAVLDKAEISYTTPTDMMRQMWWKFMVNVGINQASFVLDAPYGVFQQNKDAQDLMKALMGEVIELAQAFKIDLTTEDIQSWNKMLVTLAPDGQTSMLQDRKARRMSEVDMFAGKIIRMGKELSIPTPVNSTIYKIIKVIESGYSKQENQE
ncbi:ketopantoate reductase family protein [Spirochaeta cellobiosiphila]|uniref:ketopantoate reductase family protein n=1 Tax=Spirochaeta cellobiosiphila TaxID=504483 RepID=UPI0003FC96B7|nr:ketopantoate reductase family protein [Spirochaeta cellobiosiphila]